MHKNVYIYIYIYIYEAHTISFQTFFLGAFNIVVDSWKFTILLLYILLDDWPIFMISGSNQQPQQELEYTLLNPDGHSRWISKMQSDTLEERCAIKLCFKIDKKAPETYGMLQMLLDHLAWIQHEFLSRIGDSKKTGSLWGMMGGVEGVKKSIHQSWLAKELGLWLGLLCWGFKGVQEKIRSEEARTLQIGSVAFPPGQYTSPQLHPCHWLFDQDGRQNRSSPCLLTRTCSLCFLVIPSAQRLSLWNNWWDERGYDEWHWHKLTQENFHRAFQNLLRRYNKWIATGGDYFEGN